MERSARRFGHFGITVSNLGDAIDFYKLLGLEHDGSPPLEVSGAAPDTMIGTPAVNLLVTVVSLDGVGIELIEYRNPEGRKATALDTNDAGSAHLCIEVDDLPMEYSRLRSAGVKFRGVPATMPDGDHGLGGVSGVYGLDPDGNVFELVSGLQK